MSAKNTFALLILAAIGLSCANKQQLAQVIVAEADRHLESGSLDAAIAAYERAIALDPKSIDPRLNLARTHASRGQYAMATEAVIAALDVEPSHPRGTLLLGQLHLAQQSYAEAVAALEEAQALLPGEFRPAFDLSLARLAVDGFIRGAVRPGAPPSGVLIDVDGLRERDLPVQTQDQLDRCIALSPSPAASRPLRRLLATRLLIAAERHKVRGEFNEAIQSYRVGLSFEPTVIETAVAVSAAFGYDANGNNIISVDANGDTTTYDYDAADRLIRIRYQDGAVVEYGYDGVGNLVRIADGTGETSLRYDELNRAQSRQFPNGMKVRYRYGFQQGTSFRVTVYPDGREVTHVYDASGRLAELRDGGDVTTYEYSDAGYLNKRALPNGIVSRFTYDRAGRAIAAEHQTVSGLTLSYEYDLDAAGRPTRQMRVTPSETSTTTYAYNKTGRLIEEKRSQHDWIHYRYDAAGNRTLRATAGDTTEYVYDRRHRLRFDGSRWFDYDGNGNLVQILSAAGAVEYGYDFENRLVAVSDAGREIAFQYRSDGQRWSRSAEGRTQFEITGAEGELLLRADGSGQQMTEFVSAGEMVREGGMYYLYDRPGGSVVAVSDSSGEFVALFDYTLLGESRSNSDDQPAEFGFGGRRVEPATGLLLFGNRFYDPQTGRYLTKAATPGDLLLRYENPYADIDVSIAVAPKQPILVDASTWASGDPFAIALGDELRGSYETPTQLGAEPPKPISVDGILSDPRLPPLVSPVVRQLWEDDLVSPLKETLMVSLPHTLEATAKSVRERSIDMALSHIQGRWQWAPGRRQPSAVASAAGGVVDVQPQKVRESLSQSLSGITRVTAASFDSRTRQLVLAGEYDESLPPVNPDDLVIVLRSIYKTREDPAVSIGTSPSDRPGYKKVDYFGGTAQTSFGLTMFEADYVLKTLSIGMDSTETAMTPDLEGYRSVVDWSIELDELALGMTWNSRVWFVPAKVTIRRNPEGKGILIDDIPIAVLSESKFSGRSVSQKGAEAFAAHLTEQYSVLGELYPSIRKLPELAKLVAIAKWMRDHRIPVDLSWIDAYELRHVDTPEVVKPATASRQKHVQGGVWESLNVTLEGGVSFRTPNKYETVSYQTDEDIDDALTHRPKSGESDTWKYTAEGKQLTAVALALGQSRRDGQLALAHADLVTGRAGTRASLVRYYNSFEVSQGPFGAGWSAVPYRLRLRRELSGAPGEDGDVYDGDEAVIEDRPNGRSESYTIQSSVFRGHGLSRDDEGNFSLSQAGGGKLHFDSDGQLQWMTLRNGERIDYRYDGDRLVGIRDGTREIRLHYDGDRIIRATDTAGTTIHYVYDEAGNLVQTTSSAGRTTAYRYDGGRRLVEAASGTPESFQAQYDSLGRIRSYEDGAGRRLEYEYDLNTQQTTVRQQGREQTRQFDDTYRMRRQVDAQGQAVAIDYNRQGLPRGITGARGNTVKLDYSFHGDLVEFRSAQGGRTRLDYSDRGLAFIEGASGRGKAFDYDERGNLVRIVDAAQSKRDVVGRLESYTEKEQGSVTNLGYDDAGVVSQVTDAAGRTTSFERDESGVLTGVVDARGGGLTATVDSVTAQISRISDSEGRAVEFSRDASGNLTGISTEAGEFEYGYDDIGRLSSIKGPGGGENRRRL